ncbi:leucyl aminopeptidase [Oleiphilus sp. HI0125]|nr:leucyl aminopeptidase family protein [Oleiphilus sp. HI0125]KZZ61761.1 leucyl aminopeptidase [Oleiphilus sp. HI0125]
MRSALISGQAQNNIILVLEDNYKDWLSDQHNNDQLWLESIKFEGKGHSTLPSENNSLKIICCIPSLNNFFLAGDLAKQLPLHTYQIDLSALTHYGNVDQETLALTHFRFAVSWGLGAYEFSQYKKTSKEKALLAIDDESLLSEANNMVESIVLTRDLINTPASDMMPEDLAQTMQALASAYEGSFSEIIGQELLDQNYPLIHAVGRASVHEPRLLELVWGDEDAPAITLVGKGICFDSGGLNIKTGNFMRQMKKDMGGAAHVLGLAKLIMAQNLPIRLRVLVAAAENAISGNAFRPGDIIESRKGLTVEIDNTDAEGRLVLCDALDDACSESPELIIDFATLTGACRVALGTELPGFFCNDEEVAAGLNESALDCLDPIWRLPLHQAYNDMLKSHFADTLNSAETGFGGAITAALYLEKFISNETPWVHFDVMAWNLRGLPSRPVGGEALGLRAVYEYLKQRFA